MGMMINRRREMGGKSTININVKTHSTGNSSASLDVTTGDGVSVNIRYQSVTNTPWTNGYIQVKYTGGAGSLGWQVYAITSCLYDGQVYGTGDLIANWKYSVVKDITIIANI